MTLASEKKALKISRALASPPVQNLVRSHSKSESSNPTDSDNVCPSGNTIVMRQMRNGATTKSSDVAAGQPVETGGAIGGTK